MQHTPLLTGWRILGRTPQADAPDAVQPPDPADAGWLPCEVPGDVNDALVRHGRMPDPRFDTRGRDAYWVTSREWWYRLEFAAPDAALDGADLCLDRVDGTADFWLNGRPLGTTRNAFRRYRFDVGGRLRATGNELLVRFRAIDALLGGPRLDELRGWEGRRAFLRKPQFNFGWDWALPLPSIGLAGHVALEWDHATRLVDVAIQTTAAGRADFAFEVTRAAREAGYSLAVRVSGHGADGRETLAPDTYTSYVSLQMPRPELWFPNGVGRPALYDYAVELAVGGRVVDTRAGRFGFRESRLAERPWPPEAGRGFSFEIEINGQPVFCKGANWIPLELWSGTIRPEQYRFYLERARDAHFTMLRVWGGGLYEPDLFYDLCDEYGLMVWQDFMFASTGYPLDALRDEIRAEAEDQIRRLRNHPSIVLWCGCNEDVYAWWHPNDRRGGKQADGETVGTGAGASRFAVDRLRDDPELYGVLLRGSVGQFGLGVPYVTSSPASRDDAGNAPTSGNAHLSCWKFCLFESREHPERFRDHFEARCSFDSEFCIQGPCRVRTFRRFLAPEHLWPPNDAWTYHIQRGHANLPHHEQTLLIAGAVIGPIDSLETYVKHGQATHAEMMRAEFESARRDRPLNGGTMMWMYNDCWPTSNWSILDYDRAPKPAYYAARRACAPLLPIVFERAGQVEFFFANDTLEPRRVELCYGQEDLDGTAVWSRTAVLDAPANGTVKFDALARRGLILGPGDYLFVDAVANGRALERVVYFPDGWRGVPWPRPALAVEILGSEPEGPRWRTRVAVRTDAFARLAHLDAPEALATWFDDNYFDLTAGATREIEVTANAPLNAADLRAGHWWTPWE